VPGAEVPRTAERSKVVRNAHAIRTETWLPSISTYESAGEMKRARETSA
jgi:hypothetical protein